ncbi:MAG: hypothetical protein KAG18_05990, partial [Sinobacterium sp.]|nr:hypothetical protein [Sinobacterium sp.]
MKISPILISTVLLSALLSSCANTKISNNESLVLAAQKEASQNQLSTAEIIEQASLNLSKARSEQLNFYAPLHISKADDKLKDAQKLNRKAETDEEKQNAKAAAISVQKLIDKAYKTKIIVEQQLAEAFERKTIVDDLGAKKALPKQYRKTIESLTLLIKEVEGGFFDAVAKDQPDLLEKFAKLEADTMRELWLEKAIIMLDKADDADADDFVEATYEKAEKAIDSANDFIDAHYRDRDGVKEAAFKAYNLASQAYYLAIEAEQLFKADEEEIESYLLKIQKRFNTINEEGYVENLPSHSFKEQAKLLAKQLDAQSKSLALTTAERDKLKLQLAGDASEETHNEA